MGLAFLLALVIGGGVNRENRTAIMVRLGKVNLQTKEGG
jgi:hypothetical protein